MSLMGHGTFPVHINKFANRFNWLTFTKKFRNRLTSGITNDNITCITGTGKLTNIRCFDELANTTVTTDITFIHTIGNNCVNRMNEKS